MPNLQKLCLGLIALAILGCNSKQAINNKKKEEKPKETKEQELPQISSDFTSKVRFNKDGSEVWPIIDPSRVVINFPKKQGSQSLAYTSRTIVVADVTKPPFPDPISWERYLVFASGYGSAEVFYPRVIVAPRKDGTYGVCWQDEREAGKGGHTVHIQNMNADHTKGTLVKYTEEIANGYEYYTPEDFKDRKTTREKVYTKKNPKAAGPDHRDKIQNIAGCAATDHGYIFGYTIGSYNSGSEKVLSRMYSDYKREYIKFRKIDKNGNYIRTITMTGDNPKLHIDWLLDKPNEPDTKRKWLGNFANKTSYKEYVEHYFMAEGSPYQKATTTATIAEIKKAMDQSKHTAYDAMVMGTSQIAVGKNNFGVMFSDGINVNAGRGGEHEGAYLGFLKQRDFTFTGLENNKPSYPQNNYSIHSLQQKLMYGDGVYTAMSLNDGPDNIWFQAFNEDGTQLTSQFLMLKSQKNAAQGLHGNIPFGELGGALTVKNSNREKFGVLFTAAPNYPDRTDWNLWYALLEKHPTLKTTGKKGKKQLPTLSVKKLILLTNYSKKPEVNENPAGTHPLNPKIAYYGDNFLVMYQETSIWREKVRGRIVNNGKINTTYGMIINPEGKILYGLERLNAPIFRETNLQNLPNGDIIWATGTPKPERNLLIHTIQYNPKLK